MITIPSTKPTGSFSFSSLSSPLAVTVPSPAPPLVSLCTSASLTPCPDPTYHQMCHAPDCFHVQDCLLPHCDDPGLHSAPDFTHADLAEPDLCRRTCDHSHSDFADRSACSRYCQHSHSSFAGPQCMRFCGHSAGDFPCSLEHAPTGQSFSSLLADLATVRFLAPSLSVAAYQLFLDVLVFGKATAVKRKPVSNITGLVWVEGDTFALKKSSGEVAVIATIPIGVDRRAVFYS